jgi:hypothetical protein
VIGRHEIRRAMRGLIGLEPSDDVGARGQGCADRHGAPRSAGLLKLREEIRPECGDKRQHQHREGCAELLGDLHS